MTRFALSIFAYQISGQVIHLALVLVASYLPSVVVSPIAGVFIDRKGPRLLLLIGSLLGIIALGIGLVVLTISTTSLWIIMFLAVSLSCISAIENPALQALTPRLIDKEYLTRANGFLASAVSLSDIIGPALAGILIGFSSMVTILLINWIGFLFAFITILLLWKQLNVETKMENEQEKSFLGDFVAGLRYLFLFKALFAMIMFHTWLNLWFGINSVMRQPYVLSFTEAQQFGILTSLFAVGMLIGSLLLSIIKVSKHLIRIVFSSAFGMAICVLFTGWTTSIFIIGFLWLLMGFLLPINNSISVSLIQKNVDSAYIGRVFSLSRMLSWATLPLAYIVGGFVADQLVKVSFHFELLSFSFGPYSTLLTLAGLALVLTTFYYINSPMKDLEQKAPKVEKVN
jgi:MFS family permease